MSVPKPQALREREREEFPKFLQFLEFPQFARPGCPAIPDLRRRRGIGDAARAGVRFLELKELR